MREKINISKTIRTIMTINILQIVLAAGTAMYGILSKNPVQENNIINLSLILIVIVFAVVLSSFITIKNLYFADIYSKERDSISNTLNQMEKLNITLRAQRHDFMSQLQVVYNLMEMEDYKEATDYIEKIFGDIQKVNKILKTSNAAVNALLQAKSIDCEKQGIEMHLNISSQYSNLKIPSWELCRVLGNIIDNAIFALRYKGEEKQIDIELFEDIKYYWFRIRNNGSEIPGSIIDRIFEAGYTTKGDKGEGMGLAISTEIMKSYSGGLSVTSNKIFTEFEGFFPKDNQ
jgi:two-component system, LytTR family, sensor histidine kinase AgrC